MRLGHARLRAKTAGLVVGTAMVFALVTAPTMAAGASTAKISPSFVAKANAGCKAVTAKFKEAGMVKFPYPSFNPTKPQPALLKKVGKFLDKGVKVWESIPAELRNLGMPAQGAATWSKIRAAADQYEANAVAEAKTASAGNAKGFTAEVHKFTQVSSELGPAALAGGFTKSSACAKLLG
jgi:hypothetical protein